jgi:hypothetical protein
MVQLSLDLIFVTQAVANRPMDTPLFPVYLWLTFAGVVVNALVAILIWRQGKTNKIAADAARISAEALMASERAFLVIFYENYLHMNRTGTLPGEQGIPYTKDSDHIFSWHVFNSGKTPAFLTKAWSRLIEIRSLGELANEPDYSQGTDHDNVLEPLAFGDKSLWFSTKIEFNPKFGGTSHLEIENRFRTQKTYLYAYGYAQYKDAFGNLRETRFGYLYKTQEKPSRKDGWQIAGPATYNLHK